MIQLPEGSWWDWEVVAWEPGLLRLAAGHDLTYAHHLELSFTDPAYVTCPTAFQAPVFRAPTPEETADIARRLGDPPAVLLAFEAEAGGSEPLSCLIAADRVDIVRGTVFRYWREDLAPGERLAPWVRPPAG